MIDDKIEWILAEANRYDLYEPDVDAEITQVEFDSATKALDEYTKQFKAFCNQSRAHVKEIKKGMATLDMLESKISMKYQHLGVDDTDAGFEVARGKIDWWEVSNMIDALYDSLSARM